MSTTVHTTDVAVVGAGPVGLFAIFECGMLGLKCHVIDSLEAVGGQCAALYPDKPIYDIPACPKLMAGELVARLAEQAAPFAPAYHLGQQVVAVAPAGAGWRLETSSGTRIDARAVIVAAMAGIDDDGVETIRIRMGRPRQRPTEDGDCQPRGGARKRRRRRVGASA